MRRIGREIKNKISPYLSSLNGTHEHRFLGYRYIRKGVS
jgi:hypothetical protein